MGRNRNFRYACGDEFSSNPYAVLGLKNSESDQKLIKQHGKALRKLVHPDKNPNNEHAQDASVLVSSAIDFLMDANTKSVCDRIFRLQLRRHKVEAPTGNEGLLLADFHRRRNEIQRTQENERRRAMAKAYFGALKNFSRRWLKGLRNSIRHIYATQSGRIRKAYRHHVKRWSHGGKVKPSTKTPKTPKTPRSSKSSKGSPPTPTQTKSADERPAVTTSTFPITDRAFTRTVSVTETETVTKTETETETVTVLGVNIAKHQHDAKEFIRSIKPEHMAAGAALVVGTGCIAGCYFLVRKHWRNQRQAVTSDAVLDQVGGLKGQQSNTESSHDAEDVVSEDHVAKIDQDGQDFERDSELGETSDDLMVDRVNMGEDAEDHGMEVEAGNGEEQEESDEVLDTQDNNTSGGPIRPDVPPGSEPEDKGLESHADSTESPDADAADTMNVDELEQPPKFVKRKGNTAAKSPNTKPPRRSTRRKTPVRK